jgi:hypothetical protein
MTTSLFKITPTPPTSVKLEPGQEGKFSFTVESMAAPDKVHEIMLQALLMSDGKGTEVDWLVAGPQRTLSMSGGKTETVTITARPTPTSPRGENRVKLVIADRDRPNDIYADSPSVACDVSAPTAVTKPTTTKLPRWLIPAIMGGLLLVGGGVLVVGKITGNPPSVPTKMAQGPSSPSDLMDDASGQTFELVLNAMLDGKPINADSLTTFSCDMLSKLRNAAYARYGLEFKTPALNTFFYDKHDGDWHPKFPTLKERPELSKTQIDKMLDRIDTSNVQTIEPEEKEKRCPLPK